MSSEFGKTLFSLCLTFICNTGGQKRLCASTSGGTGGSVVGEPRSHMLHGVAKKKKKKMGGILGEGAEQLRDK